MSGSLSNADRHFMTTQPLERVREAIRAGDTDRAMFHLDQAEKVIRSLQGFSFNWVASLLSTIGRRVGEEAVEDALRVFGEEFVRDRRAEEWDALPASTRAKVIAESMLANFSECEVDEDDEKITLRFRCGSGGRLIDEGCYETEPGAGDGYVQLSGPAPRTLGRDRLPVYCAHCPVNNEIQPVEWGGAPTTVEHPPEAPGEPCIHHVYKVPAAIPVEIYERLGLSP
jgi:hypothetical protein